MAAREWVFLGSSACLARINRADPNHTAAQRFLATKPQLITSNFIVDEAITLVLKRLGYLEALSLGNDLWSGQLARIFYLTRTQQREAWAFFQQYHDKTFSFTDCTSFVLMRRLGLTHVFTFDADFEQTGLFVRVPR